MTGYLIAGLVLGSLYAILAAGVSLTYASTGILNFAFGAIAFFIARFYYFLNSQHGLAIPYAAVVALGSGPVLGLILYWSIFRHLRYSSSVVKVVATVGVSVALPSLATMLFGNQTILQAPGITPQPVGSFLVAGVAITTNQLAVFGALLLVVLIGVAFRFTQAGLSVRAIVDSEAMTGLSGTNPTLVYQSVWAVSTFFAGLVGILAGPTTSLQPSSYATLTAAAFAAVIVGKLKSIPVSVGAGIIIGIASSLIQYWMPQSSPLTFGVVDSVPFVVIAVAVTLFMRSGRLDEREGVGGALDRAVMPWSSTTESDSSAVSSAAKPRLRSLQSGLGLSRANVLQATVVVALCLALPQVLSGSWASLVAEAIAFGIVFLSMTITTGEGGEVWLCQITFAGIGAVITAQLVTNEGWPVLPAVLVGALIAVPIGLLVGFFTIRLGDLYVALTTLTFGLLMDNLVFTLNKLSQGGAGVILFPPKFAGTSNAFSYLTLGVFCLIALFVVRLRRSTTGLALSAVRWSESGARSIGISVLQMKLVAAGLGAFVAAIGGAFLAMYAEAALPTSYNTLEGLVWLAVLVTVGIRSNIAALVAGFVFAFLPAIFQIYLPVRIGLLPSVLFGLGAVGLAMSPDGVLTQYAQAFGRVGKYAMGKLHAPAVDNRERDFNRATLPAGTIEDAIAGLGWETMQRDRARRTTANGEGAQTILRAEGVTVRFGGLIALDDVSMQVQLGSITGLIGPNGAGKSTLFGVMSGLLTPSYGKVLLEGEDISLFSPQRRARCGLSRTFQHPEVFAGLTVREHLVLAHRSRVSPSRVWTDLLNLRGSGATERQQVESVIDLLSLGPVADRVAGTLSLGLCRRLEVARAMAMAPRVILLDEPSSGLDERESEDLSVILQQLVKYSGISLVLVEHEIAMVLGLCSEIYVLDSGRLIAQGDPHSIKNDAEVRRAYLGDVDLVVAGVE